MIGLSLDAAKMLAQAFISSHLDYCNSTLYGITDSLFRRLQAVQNATARLITGVQLPAQGPHHSDPAAALLAPGPRTSHLQARLVGFQGVARSVAAVSRGWLSAASQYRAPSSPIVWRCDLFCPADSLVSRRSLFRCGWTENMEQFAYQIATTKPQPWTI